jgi:hypothetical protein
MLEGALEQPIDRTDQGSSKWIWIGGAAIATFLIASVLPTGILRAAGLSCLNVFQAFGTPGYSCFAPFNGTLELGGGGLTMSLNLTAKIVLSLIAAGITAWVIRRRGHA